MPFCMKCGKQLEDTLNFCPACGTAVLHPEQTPAAPQENSIPEEVLPQVDTPAEAEQIIVEEPAPVEEESPVAEEEAFVAAEETPAVAEEAPVAPFAAPVPPAAEPAFVVTPPPAPEAPAEPAFRPIGVGSYFGSFILQFIPVVGLIMAIVWSCNKKNRNRRNFGIACLILHLIVIVLSIFSGLGIYLLIDDIMKAIISMTDGSAVFTLDGLMQILSSMM